MPCVLIIFSFGVPEYASLCISQKFTLSKEWWQRTGSPYSVHVVLSLWHIQLWFRWEMGYWDLAYANLPRATQLINSGRKNQIQFFFFLYMCEFGPHWAVLSGLLQAQNLGDSAMLRIEPRAPICKACAPALWAASPALILSKPSHLTGHSALWGKNGRSCHFLEVYNMPKDNGEVTIASSAGCKANLISLLNVRKEKAQFSDLEKGHRVLMAGTLQLSLMSPALWKQKLQRRSRWLIVT